MKIYTRKGDRGKTSLAGGQRVEKNHLRIETYGDLDELNSYAGLVLAGVEGEELGEIKKELHRIQSLLFAAGAWLATPGDSKAISGLSPFPPEADAFLENAIDRMEENLPGLTGFILPGGHPAAATAHVARCVCRRCERKIVALILTLETPPESVTRIQAFVNRLSDYFFILARALNQHFRTPEKPLIH